MLDRLEIGGRRFEIEYLYQKRKTTAAYFYENKVTIKLPLSLDARRRAQALDSIERMVVRRLEKLSRNEFRGLDNPSPAMRFVDGQQITVLGRTFILSVTEDQSAKYPSARLGGGGGSILLTIPAGTPEQSKTEHVSELVRKVLSRCMLPEVRMRLERINDAHYGFSFNEVKIKKQMRLWGSASHPKNNINLNYRLLFAPDPIIEYVMAHELSHLGEHNHSGRFWELVAKAVPDHRQRRKWLRENGAGLGTAKQEVAQQQQAAAQETEGG